MELQKNFQSACDLYRKNNIFSTATIPSLNDAKDLKKSIEACPGATGLADRKDFTTGLASFFLRADIFSTYFIYSKYFKNVLIFIGVNSFKLI